MKRLSWVITCCAAWLGWSLATMGVENPSFDQAPTRARYVNPARLDLRIPQRHPYLVFTSADVERAKEGMAKQIWKRQIYDRCISEADANLGRVWDKLPKKDDREHERVAGRLFSAGLAYALSGDKRYALWARDGLLAYADLYPTLPLTSGRCKVYQSESLYEATWAVKIAQAYDLVADSGTFTGEQKKHVEDDLLRGALVCFRIDDFRNDPRIQDLHYRCYNFQAWHMAAMGLIGMAVRDADSVDYAINSPYGFRHLVGHDIRDDGLFWERSMGYHTFVLEALLPLAEALSHCGVDLYGMTVPNDRSREPGAHYVTDTSDKPKSLRLMFEGPPYLAFPDLSYAAVGDSNRGPLRGTWQQLVGLERYRDPRLSWLIQRDMPSDTTEGSSGTTDPRRRGPDWHWLLYGPPAASGPPASALPLAEGAFANSGQFRNGCSLFPSSGLVVLREAGADFTVRPDSTAVSLSFGPHGGGHGHSDQMNIVVYSQGRQWIPDFGSMPYETHWKAEWTAQTVSHNTVVIDGISQRPTGARNVQWPTDEASDPVIGKLVRFAPDAKLAGVSCDSAYPGTTLRRTVRVAGHDVLDDYEVVPAPAGAAQGQHQFDYVLHIDGELADSSMPLSERSGKLGEMCGYQYVQQKRGGSAEASLALTFSSGARQLRLWIMPAGGAATDVIVGEGLTNSPTGRMPVLILRRKAAQARFITLIEPVQSNDPIRAVRFEENTRAQADSLVVERPSGTQRVALRESPR